MSKKHQPARKRTIRKARAPESVGWITKPMFVKFPPDCIELNAGQTKPQLDLVTDLQDGSFVTYTGKPLMEVARWIDYHCQLFEDTKSPLDMMEVFLASIDAGVYPPVSILKALAKAFQAVVDGEGKVKLDQALGLRGTGRGNNWTAFTNQKRRGTTFWRASVIFALTTMRDSTGKKISQEAAADRLSFFLELHPLLKFYTVEGLLDSYSRTWTKRFRLDREDSASSVHPANWTPARRAAFLQNFPERLR